ncbi:gramicidin S synthase 2 [Laceyella sacchari]|uniref:non-ribosomal peptide synthetase n=1 Tax=Laceyella sacchari TaxID=37482 RepID=UPI0010DA5881|nr:non-ribosomal peptide synthetase [Laceyella sacchari]TCW37424.1 gramicidin S synthase 2 [Laceyella sacchari]
MDKKQIADIYSLSPMQEAMLFHSIHDEGNAYFEQMSLTIEGSLDIDKFAESVQWIVDKYEVFRTIFSYKKLAKPRQVVLRRREATLDYHDISQLPTEEKEAFLSEYKRKDRAKGFDLSRDMLVRFAIVKTEANRYEFIFSHHHILMDGWCLGIVLDELFDIYGQLLAGNKPVLTKTTPYSEYIRWLDKQDHDEAKAYWKAYLEGYTQMSEIPRQGYHTSGDEFQPEEIVCTLDQTVVKRLTKLAQQHHLTLNNLFQCIWGVLLQRMNHTDDVVFGAVVSGRNKNIRNIENIVGLFINTIPVRVRTKEGASFIELAQTAKQSTIASEEYDYLSLADIQANSALNNHLFDHLFVFENYPFDADAMDESTAKMGFKVVGSEAYEQTNYQFNVLVIPYDEDRIEVRFSFNRAMFDPVFVQNLTRNFRHVIEQVLANPQVPVAEISVISEEEKQQVLTAFNQTDANYPTAQTIHQRFAEQVARTPDNIAVVFEEERLTYRELEDRANQLAVMLRERGVNRDQIVGLMVERSIEMIVGMLAILKAGGAYMPIDPLYPQDRITYMLADSGTNLLLTRKGLEVPGSYTGEIIYFDDIVWQEGAEAPTSVNEPQDMCYIIYTSGSTGNPKGVMVEHRNVIRLLFNDRNLFDFSESDVWTMFHSFSFDFSVWEMYGALLYGGKLVVVPALVAKDSKAFLDLLKRERVTVLNQTPTAFYQLSNVEMMGPKSDEMSVRMVIFGGEALAPSMLKPWRERYPQTKLINMYGITETTVHVTYKEITEREIESNVSNIGVPIPTLKVYVLDEQMNPVPIGVAGEMYVSGAGVTRGYLNRPELTAERFIEDPFNPGARMYKSGDLARWLSDGTLEYLGRIDHQVKIRGHRIELGEIETKLLEHPAINECVVMARTDESGAAYLAAYVVASQAWTATELRQHLGVTLPEYMVPSYFVELDKFPLTSNGKVNRKALPVPEKVSTANYVPPTNRIEEALVGIYQEVLGVERVGIEDHFFELGGHSIKAMMLTSRILKELDADVPLREVFARDTVKELAAYIKKAKSSSFAAIEKAEEMEYYPVSSAQKRLYVVEQLEEGGIGYNIPMTLELIGKLNREQLEHAVRQLVVRHESFRTSFHMRDGELMQKIHSDVTLQVEWVTAKDESEVQALIDARIRPFDLSQAPLCRIAVIQVEEERHIMLMDMHHIISDGVSAEMLYRELVRLYHDKTLPVQKIQYKDYAVWQQSLLQSEEWNKQEAFWLQEFQDSVPTLELKTDFPRPAVQQLTGKLITFAADPDLKEKLQSFVAEEKSTLYIVLLSVYNVLLAKYTGQEDIVVGAPITGRSHADLESVVGMFVNMLALRNFPKQDQSFTEFAADVKKRVLTAFEHGDYPFEELVEKLQEQRDLSRHPIFDTTFTIQSFEPAQGQDDTLRFEAYETDWNTAKFDMSWTFDETDWSLSVEYATHLFKPETIKRMVGHYFHLLKQIIDNKTVKLSELELVTDEEKQQLLVEFNATEGADPTVQNVVALFEEQAQRNPDHPAVVHQGQSVTYRELNDRANQLARRLRQQGVDKEQIVALMFQPSVEMLVGIWGVLKAGAAYLPIDPNYPAERVRYMLDDSRANLLLTHASVQMQVDWDGDMWLIDDASFRQGETTNLGIQAEADDLAYVIYTSGSTGQPKGVMVEHRALMNLCLWHVERFNLTVDDRSTKYAGFGFDASVWEIFPTMVAGATLYMVEEDVRYDVAALNEFFQEQGITISFLPTQFAEQFMKLPNQTLKTLLIGGDRAQHIVPQSYEVVNNYGPTENAVVATSGRIDENAKVITIGKPITNNRVYILNEHHQLQPIGVPGELCLSGQSLARGYLHRPDLTQERFVDNPFEPGQKMYKTGDLVRWLPDGTIEFLGRIDDQVKIRGFRIETGEITSRLMAHPAVQEAVVVAHTDEQETALCAYVVTTDGEWTYADMRQHLAQTLPDYMIPAHLVTLPALPMTANGKVDKKALPKPDRTASSDREYVAPQTDLERELAMMWQETLNVDRVSVLDHFFELGGHSLKAMALVSQIQKKCDVHLSLRDIFSHPTVKELATLIEQADTRKYTEINPVEKRDYYPVSSAQKRIYVTQQLEEGGISYNMPMVLRVEGQLDLARLTEAGTRLIARHESLRTSFGFVNGELVQWIHPHVEFAVTQQKIADESELDSLLSSLIQPFDLAQAPLFRMALVEVEEDLQYLVMDMHHIISDGVSVNLMLKELCSFYDGADLPPLRIHYKDFAVWQNGHRETEQWQAKRAYWLKEMGGELPVLELPTDKPRPPVQQFDGDYFTMAIDAALMQKLDRFLIENNVTLHMALMATYHVLLSKYAGQEDIIVGFPVAGRDHPDLEQMVGMFVNTLAIRTQPQPDKTFSAFLADVKERMLKALENGDYPFEELVDQLDAHRDLSRHPLFDTMFAVQNMEMSDMRLSGFPLTPYEWEWNKIKFDLSWTVEKDDATQLTIGYSTHLFEQATIARMAGHFVRLLEQIVENPDCRLADLQLVTAEEQEQLLVAFNDSEMEFPADQTIHSLWAEQVARTPDKPAVVFGQEQLTYRELDIRSNQLARLLRGKGAERNQIIALMMPPSLEMIVGMLGVLKAGAAYLPVDPNYPQHRIEHMLSDSEAALLLTLGEPTVPEAYAGETIRVEEIPWTELDGNAVDNGNDSSDLAYMIYTSGSTGKPKGVMIEHRSVCNLQLVAHALGITEDSRVLQFASFSFDASVWEIFPSLLHGATVVMEEKEKLFYDFAGWLRAQEITTMTLPPTVLKSLSPENLPALRTVVTAGEACPQDLIKVWSKDFTFINAYGPTETTVCATLAKLSPDMSKPPIGKPIANQKVYIVNEYNQLQPIGVPGELCVSGAGLARGYWNRPDLTAEKFVDNPFVPGEKMYRTGDLARWLPDGNIEYLGRIDEQVKVRGFRIETGEIEAKLLEHPAVNEAVVITREINGETVLCGYVIAPSTVGDADLRAHLATELPDYMIPSYLIQLDQFPLTPNGKVDKKALPEPEGAQTGDTYEAPSNKVEKRLSRIYEEVLNVEPVGAMDHFFKLGGNSLKAMLLTARIHQELGVQISLREVFSRPVLRDLAHVIGQAEQTGFEEIRPVEERDYYPVSSAQRRLYVTQQFENVHVGYNMPLISEIKGNLSIAQLESAFAQLVQRHESLRTSFHFHEGELVQKIAPTVPCQIERVTATNLEEAKRMAESYIRPFDLSQAPLARMTLISLAEDHHILVFDMHHIISDGMSMDILMHDLMSLYQQKTLPALKVQYKDYAVWQERYMQTEQWKKDEAYWVNQFSGALPVLELPTDYPRPNVMRFDGNQVGFQLDAALTSQVKQFASERQVTLHMVLMAAYQLLLSKYSGQDDLIVGSPVAGRPHPDLQSTVGMFVNTLAIRNRLQPEQTVESLVDAVKQQVLEAYEHAEYPLEELLERLDVQRDLSRQPLFDTLLTVQNIDMGELELPGLHIEPVDMDWKAAKFDMNWVFVETDQLELTVEYSTHLFKQETIERMVRHFTHLLAQVVNQPSARLADLELCTEEEKRQILVDFNQTQAEFPREATVHQLFEQQVAQTPERICLEWENRTMTYAEVNRRANQWARVLRANGLQPNQRVGVIADRSFNQIIALLSILKAGGAYVPIDPTYPVERIQYMLSDSDVRLLLMQPDLSVPQGYDGDVIFINQSLGLDEEDTNLSNVNTADDLAYIIYTSGSTGKPKGTLTIHRNIVRTIVNNGYIEVGEEDTLMQLSNYAFDGSTFDIYNALLNGAKLILVPKELLMSLEDLTKLIREREVTISFMTTALFNTLVEFDLSCFDKMKKIVFGGEKASLAHVKKAVAYLGDGRLINGYGPTETTVFATTHAITKEVAATNRVPIGKPLNNTTVYVLNERNQLQPIGVPGELCVAGDGVALGYLNNQKLTEERFVPNPFKEGDRMYRTGDLVRWLPDGSIDYIDRIDQQVKIRGHRIELGEIESKLLEHPGVKEAVVLALEEESGQNPSFLCAYVVCEEQEEAAALRRHLEQSLPDYMVPAHYIQLDELPLTSNGKVDKRALPRPEANADAGVEYVAPTTATEKLLAEIWQDVLKRERVGIHDNFFTLGGDSIKAIQIAARASQQQYRLQIGDLLKHPTIASLAPYVSVKGENKENHVVEGPVPVTPVQQWIFGLSDVPEHWNMAVVLHRPECWDADALRKVWRKLVQHHDALRMSYSFQDGQWTQFNRGYDEQAADAHFTVEEFNLMDESEEVDVATVIEREANRMHESLSLTDGPLVRCGVFYTHDGDYLLIIIHHLVVDAVSWRILSEDLYSAYEQVMQEKEIMLPDKTTSFKTWSESLRDYANSDAFMQAEWPYWQQVVEREVAPLPVDMESDGKYLIRDVGVAEITFSKEETEALLTEVHDAYQTEINDLLLTALSLTVKEWTGEPVAVHMEGHGREEIAEHVDVTRTVGWFTSIYPVVFDLTAMDVAKAIQEVKATIRSVPNRGIGYSLLRYMLEPSKREALSFVLKPEINFNYQGQFVQDVEAGETELTSVSVGQGVSPLNQWPFKLDFNGLVEEGQLLISVRYPKTVYHHSTVKGLVQRYQEHLRNIIAHCLKKRAEQTGQRV